MSRPSRRRQIGDSVGQMGADPVEHVTEIGKRVKMAQLAGGDETVDDGGTSARNLYMNLADGAVTVRSNGPEKQLS